MNPVSRTCPNPDLLLAFDEGVLPVALSRQVEEHLRHCVICARLKSDLGETVIAEPTLAQLDKVRAGVFGNAKRRPFAVAFAAVAAAAILVVGSLLWRPARPTPPQPVMTEAPRSPAPAYRLALESAPLRLPLATALLLRGKADTGAQAYLRELGRVLEPYRAGRYSEAAQSLAALRTAYPKAVEPPFYEGVARLLANDAAASVEALEQARRIDGEALHDDILWYLAVARERTADWPAAAALLTALCKNEGAYRKAACAALTP